MMLDARVLAELRAALSVGASPAAALTECTGNGVLAPVARAVRLGQPLAEAAASMDTSDPAAALLVRALGVAERAGAGAITAVEQALDTVREEAAFRRLLQVRTAQARGTALVLAALPVVLWVLLMLVDQHALSFYATVPGILTGVLAVALMAAGHCWSRRIVAAAGRAAEAADPLTPPRPPTDRARIAALAVPAVTIVGLTMGLGAGLVAGATGALLAARRRGLTPVKAQGAGGAAEAVELVAVAVAGGLPAGAAIEAVAPLAPPSARAVLAAAGRRLRGGWAVDAAFAGTGLTSLGAVLATTERWGAPAGPALRRLAADLRADARAAAEEAAELAQLRLVFPTTLLTLPAFVLGVVPPLLWAALAGTGGLGQPS